MKYSFTGLSEQDVHNSREQHGTNELTPQKVEGFWEKLWGNFQDPIIIILVVALFITVVLAIFGYAEWYEGVGIAIAVLLATMVATWSEYKNETSFQKLQEEASLIMANVFRNGHISEIPINDIVVGDYALLQPGDKISADGIIVAGDLEVDQAALSGETEPVKKIIAPDEDYKPKNNEDLLDSHRVFRGSVVVDDEAVMKVNTVGDKTFYGQLAKELAAEERETPLQVKLRILAEGISKFGYIGGTFIAIAFLFKKIFIDNHFASTEIMNYLSNWQGFLHDAVTSVILAVIIIVVAVPEGLPMMIAIVLSLNMRKLLKAKVLVRKLLGIETSGSLNILFSDKTGTITKGQLEVSSFASGSGNNYTSFMSIPEKLRSLLAFSLKNNTTCVINSLKDEKERLIGGDRTERALLRFIEPMLYEQNNVKIINMIPFNSTRKFSAMQVDGEKSLTLVKGSPEKILPLCKNYYDDKENKAELKDTSNLNEEIDKMANRAMRVIAVAVAEEEITEEKTLPSVLTLVGIIGLRDEIRPESSQAIAEAKQAGIHVVMITGDRKETAEAIAKDVGLLKDPSDCVLTSSEISQLSDEKLKEKLPSLHVVARALPTDKSRLVKVAQSMGYVVGMTGDGVNDAPALKKADVGFAMGSGTEVAKEAGDIVILDDNFSSITKAILYGRTIFNSIRKFIIFQLTVNVGAILVAFLGPFFGFDLPLTMIQLLWVNLVMDTLAALAFGGEAALTKYMAEKPKRRDESIINKDMWSSILTNGIAIAAISILFLKYQPINTLFHSEAAFMTGFFAFFIFLNNFNKFNARTPEINLFAHITENKGFLKVVALIFIVQIIFTYFGGDILRTVALYPKEWLYVILFSIIIIPIDLFRKAIRNALTTQEGN